MGRRDGFVAMGIGSYLSRLLPYHGKIHTPSKYRLSSRLSDLWISSSATLYPLALFGLFVVNGPVTGLDPNPLAAILNSGRSQVGPVLTHRTANRVRDALRSSGAIDYGHLAGSLLLPSFCCQPLGYFLSCSLLVSFHAMVIILSYNFPLRRWRRWGIFYAISVFALSLSIYSNTK